jgi:hypothetical protein
VLILAAAARAEVLTFRRDALRRRRDDAQQFGAGEILFHFRDFRLDRFAGDDKRNEYDKFINASDAFTAEREIVDGQVYFIAKFERHNGRLRILACRKKPFHRQARTITMTAGLRQIIFGA